MLIEHCYILQHDLRCTATRSPEKLLHTKCYVLSMDPFPTSLLQLKKKPKTPKQQFWLEHPGFSSSLLEVPKYI